MRILVISNLYPPIYLGGYELACRDVVEALRERNHTIHILSSTYNVHSANQIKQDDVTRTLHHHFRNYPKEDLRQNYIQKVRSKWVSPRNYRETKRVIEMFKPDIVYLWGLDRITPLCILLALRKKKVPAIIHLMDDWLYVMKIHHIYKVPFPLHQMKNILKRTVDDLVHEHPCIVMSKSLREDYESNGFPPEQLHLLYTGITLTPEKISEYPELKDEFRLLYAGQVGYWKGVHLILEAMRLLKEHDKDKRYTLDIIGDGYAKFLNDLKVYSNRHGLQVRLLGLKPRDELFAHMKQYHALVCPTLRKEPFGFVVVESMLAGCPVLASNIGGPSEIIQQGETGLLFNIGRPVDMANKIMQLSGDMNLITSIREKAFQEAKTRYNFEHYIDRIEELLNSTVP